MSINVHKDRDDGALATRADVRRIVREEMRRAERRSEALEGNWPSGSEPDEDEVPTLSETMEDAVSRAFDRGYARGYEAKPPKPPKPGICRVMDRGAF